MTLQMFEPINVTLDCKSKIKKWAFENSYTLIFLSFMFGLSWAVTVFSCLIL